MAPLHNNALSLMVLCALFALSVSSTLYWNIENKAPINREASKRSAERQWTFVADGRKRPYSYIDDFGALVGFDVDLVKAVCALANKRCNFILAEYQECIETYKGVTHAGRGIQSDWFDACPGYADTPERNINFDFTLPYLKTTSTFTVAPGNPKKFDPYSDDFSKLNLMYLSGAPTNNQCLIRLGKKFGNIINVNSLPEAKEALLNGTADVLFSPRTRISGLDVLDARFSCSKVGAGIMVKKGNKLPLWWDEAFARYYMSGNFTKLCREGDEKHGVSPHCILPGEEGSEQLEALIAERANKPMPDGEKLNKFVVSGKVPPFSFINKEGELVGFTKDLLTEVCKRAGKKCALVTGKVAECSIRPRGEIMYPGRGLSEGWFDACTGYFNTVERRNSWDFTLPYLASAANFRVKPGNPSGFDPGSADYSRFNIVYLESAISNDHCLNRLHKKVGKLIVVPGEDVNQAVECVKNGTADAWFSKYHHDTPLETLPEEFHCENVGTSVMVPKGSDIPSWFDPAFEAWWEEGGFNKFCDKQGYMYDVKFPCIPGPDSAKKSGPSIRTSDEGF